MKARRIDLSETVTPGDAMRRVAIVRFAEVLSHAPGLRDGEGRALHALRIASKRLRYALERFAPREPSLFEAATRLKQMQDVLGSLHDRDVLIDSLPAELRRTAGRLRDQRAEALARARALWRDGFALYGPFEGLMRFTGLGYGEGDGEAPPGV